MKLSADLFKQIIETLKGDAPATSHEKRGQGRVGLRVLLDIIPCEAGTVMKSHPVWVRDISVNGLGILSETAIQVGLLFAGRFAREGTTPLTILYKVMYCRKLPGGQFSVGAQLERVIVDPKARSKEAADSAIAAPAA